MRQGTLASRLLVAVAVVVAASAGARSASAEVVVEKWRSPLGFPRAAAVAPDGSVWAATGSSLTHLAPDGTTLAQIEGFTSLHPERAVTRDQMAVYMARAFELPL